MHNFSDAWKPVSPWTGRLVLPGLAQRKVDGGVFIKIENAPPPHAALIGTECWLAMDVQSEWASHVACEFVPIRFDADTNASVAEGNVHPYRLNGWHEVSPLESLAGGRMLDDVRVSLQHPVVRIGQAIVELVVDREPVQIEGSHKALAAFVRPVDSDESAWTVRHWNPYDKKFTGAAETVRCATGIGFSGAAKKVPQSSLHGVHQEKINEDGFYLYALPGESAPVLMAIEPRALSRVVPEGRVGEPLDEYLAHGLWSNLAYGTWHSSYLFASGDQAKDLPAPVDSGDSSQRRGRDSPWREGDSGFVIHLFGWRSGPSGDPPGKDGHVPGHAASGFFAVIRDEFTGECRFEIEYAQVYSHNPEGILAGFIARHSFLGSLARGLMWLSPVSDVLVRGKVLEPIMGDDGEALVSPLEEYRLSLSRMLARTRTGAGTGLTPATMAVSCSQNTALALFEASARIGLMVRSALLPGPRHTVAAGLDSPAVAMMHALDGLCEKLRRKFVPLGIGKRRLLPPRWNAYLGKVPYVRTLKNTALWLRLNAALTINSVLPRELHDNLARLFHENGADLHFLRSNQVGGVIPGIVPEKPTTFRDRYGKNG